MLAGQNTNLASFIFLSVCGWEFHQRPEYPVAASQHGRREPGTNPVCLLHQRKHQLQRRTRDGHDRNRESRQDGQHSRLHRITSYSKFEAG